MEVVNNCSQSKDEMSSQSSVIVVVTQDEGFGGDNYSAVARPSIRIPLLIGIGGGNEYAEVGSS